MSNQSYCRFENTLRDLRDCREHLCNNISDREAIERKKLIELCREIAEEFEGEDLC